MASTAMDFHPPPIKILPDLEDFELKKGYMRALIQFAEDGVIRDDASDTDSVVSRKPGGDGITLAPEKAYISCRISSVPAFTWPDNEPLQTPDHDTEPTTADTDSILSASTVHSPGPLQETFASLTTTTTRDLDVPSQTALRPPPHPSRKKPSHPLPLLTVQEEPPRHSLSATNSPTNATLAPLFPAGRPSTSTPSSASSRRLGTKSLRGTSPTGRRSGESIFRLFRPGTSSSPPTTFLERRTLTPHDRLAPIPRQQPDPSIPPVPPIDPSHWDVTTTTAVQEEQGDGDGDGVFGVPLDISIALAPTRIRVSHRGSAVSHRSVPLCVYKCAEYIRLSAPHPPTLFSPATRRPAKVDALHSVFNTAPHYGATFDFTTAGEYTPSDAAHLILLYLERLPKPVVPQSVVKGWIVLARRHARPGGTGGGMEEEETLDFWAEALNRLGTMERNLVKLVLEVFAVVLGADGEGERGLAGDVAGTMLHGEEAGGGGLLRRMSRGRRKEGRRGEAVAALGFLVRRRGEYLRGLGGGGGEGGFLPSVGEVMGWRGGSDTRV